jgi:mannose-6-phosphate isomerase-like protein (cupin superfamily)
MKHATFKQASRFANSEQCTVYEYPLNDPDINGALVELDGRYPEKGYAVNRVCKELAFIVSGQGKLIIKGKDAINLSEKDTILIDPGEEYYWVGKLTMFMPCTPAWYAEQHQMTE